MGPLSFILFPCNLQLDFACPYVYRRFNVPVVHEIAKEARSHSGGFYWLSAFPCLVEDLCRTWMLFFFWAPEVQFMFLFQK